MSTPKIMLAGVLPWKDDLGEGLSHCSCCQPKIMTVAKAVFKVSRPVIAGKSQKPGKRLRGAARACPPLGSHRRHGGRLQHESRIGMMLHDAAFSRGAQCEMQADGARCFFCDEMPASNYFTCPYCSHNYGVDERDRNSPRRYQFAICKSCKENAACRLCSRTASPNRSG